MSAWRGLFGSPWDVSKTNLRLVSGICLLLPDKKIVPR